MQSPVGHVGVISRHFLANAHAGHKRDRGNIKFNTVCSQLQTLRSKLGMLGARQLG
jgi:hypothetical protein